VLQTRLTVAEFLQQPDREGIVEFIDGEIYVNSPKDLHQAFTGSVFVYLKSLKLGGSLWIAPISIYFDEHNSFKPDVIWVSPDSRCVLGDDGYWHGAPDLVVEVFSPATERKDKIEKYRLYQKHGMREYWMVNPDARYLEVHRREGDQIRLHGFFSPYQTFESPLLGRTIDVTAAFNS
jgi:Uma2 family endonuclease